MYSFDDVKTVDPELAESIELELGRQRENIVQMIIKIAYFIFPDWNGLDFFAYLRYIYKLLPYIRISIGLLAAFGHNEHTLL